MATTYTAKDITVLEGLDPVRKRPGMYIGGVGSAGLHHLVWEIVDNSVDEAMNGYATEINVTLHKDGQSVTVSDNGRGIPVDIHPTHKKSALEIVYSTLHAGGKFEAGNYKTSGGLHGVGASVVNALSSKVQVTVKRDGAEWQIEFSRGVVVSKLKKLGVAKGLGYDRLLSPGSDHLPPRSTSTRIRSAIRLEIASYLHRGLKVNFTDESSAKKETFFHQDGILDYLKKVLTLAHSKPAHEAPFVLNKDGESSGWRWCSNGRKPPRR